jgi:hypothetical protein
MGSEYHPHRSNEELTDVTPEDMYQRIPSEETAIQFAETMSPEQIFNEIARLSAAIELHKATIKQVRDKLELDEFTLDVYQKALQLAQDKNPGT